MVLGDVLSEEVPDELGEGAFFGGCRGDGSGVEFFGHGDRERHLLFGHTPLYHLDGMPLVTYNEHMTTEVLRNRRQYAINTLAGDLSPARRAVLEASLARFDAQLGVRCGCCGRRLEADRSTAAGIGPVCAQRVCLMDVPTPAQFAEDMRQIYRVLKGEIRDDAAG